jgi:hypothetical protein
MSSGNNKNVKKKQKHELTIISSRLHDFISPCLLLQFRCTVERASVCLLFFSALRKRVMIFVVILLPIFGGGSVGLSYIKI